MAKYVTEHDVAVGLVVEHTIGFHALTGQGITIHTSFEEAKAFVEQRVEKERFC